MDAHVMTPREALASVAFIQCNVPSSHPSAQILGEERMGTAVAVDHNRLLTAHYLVLGAETVTVVASGGEHRRVSRVAIDHDSGLALLSLEDGSLRPVPLGSSEVAAGTPVFLLTCAGASERKGATGHVTAVGPFEAFWEYMLDRAIMTTAVNPGLAGAPLLDGVGRLLGIVALGLGAVGRYSLAIPLHLYLERRQGLEQGLDWPQPPRAWIGFYPQEQEGSVVITGVVPGGPADKAGIARGDLVLSVDGIPVASLRELYTQIWKRGSGETVDVQLLGESGIRVVEVVAGDRARFYK
jgi:S1-C subfamily serine protease